MHAILGPQSAYAPACPTGTAYIHARSVVHRERLDVDKDLEDLVEIARIWMQSDIHAVEQALERVSSPFLRNGVQFVIDNVPEQDILDLLQWRGLCLRLPGPGCL